MKTVNNVPVDHYGVWCPHGKHIMVADPAATDDRPAMVPANPWPCSECSYEEFQAEMTTEAHEAEQGIWDEWKRSQ